MFQFYGARGIDVCDEWKNSFIAFYEHIGPRPSKEYSVDRIDNSRGYEPGNVRWATRSMQIINQSRRKKITIDGESRALTEWARLRGIKPNTLLARIKKSGWDVERAVNTPVRQQGKAP